MVVVIIKLHVGDLDSVVTDGCIAKCSSDKHTMFLEFAWEEISLLRN